MMHSATHEKFLKVRDLSEQINNIVHIEEQNLQVGTAVSPNKWQLGHTTWIFEELILKKYLSGYKPFADYTNIIYNSYYNSLGKQLIKTTRHDQSSPYLAEVMAFRKHVEENLFKLLNSPEGETVPKYLIEIGMHHEQQHIELMLVDIQYNLFHTHHKRAIIDKSYTPSDYGSHKQNLLQVNEGLYSIGHCTEVFYDNNETPEHKYFLQDFSISEKLVTNGEYLEFILAGQYDNPLIWLSDSWEWVQNNAIDSPLYWVQKGDIWYEYTFYGLNEQDLNKPVTHISYYEADAYARFVGMRLPLEQEYETALNIHTNQDSFAKSHFLDYDLSAHNFMDGAMKPNLEGEAWCWTNSAYLPYPGFKLTPDPFGEYSGKFMVNHMVLKGGCHFTIRDHIRNSYRNFFKPDKRWMLSGIRLAR